jgi:uncharacterized protein (UPF0332 family)
MIEPRDFLDFAEKTLAAASGREINYRMAAARAYYSVLLLVRDELGIQDERAAGNSHQQVRVALLSIPPDQTRPFLRVAKQQWNSLQTERERADYRINGDFDEHKAQMSVGRARLVFNEYDKGLA